MAFGTDVILCDLLGKYLLADFGALFNNAEAVSAGVPYRNHSLGTALAEVVLAFGGRQGRENTARG